MFVRLEEGTRRAIAEAATARAEARREAEEAEKVKVFQCENIPEKVEVFQCQLSLSRLEAPKLLLSMLLCSGPRNIERWLLLLLPQFSQLSLSAGGRGGSIEGGGAGVVLAGVQEEGGPVEGGDGEEGGEDRRDWGEQGGLWGDARLSERAA